MLHPIPPPEGSYVDSNGKRWITLDIDIMVNHGERFFCTFRYTAPVTFDYEIGWLTMLDNLQDALYKRYTSLQHRDDVRIILGDAKVLKHTNNKFNSIQNDKVRNCKRVGRTQRHATR